MRTTITLAISTLFLAGCSPNTDRAGPGPKSQGRYAGIGTYEAGAMWRQMADVKTPADPAAATIQDDEQIIVVIDSHSGEVRQCGDRSGVCVAMDPWSTRQAAAPVRVKQHLADLTGLDDAEAENLSDPAEPAAKH